MSGINVRLVSQDGELYKLCREILTEIAGLDWRLVTAENDTSNITVCIWDLEGDGDAPQGLHQGLTKHLFLVHRKDVPRFHECLGLSDPNVLPKPVPPANLSALLGLAISPRQDGISA